MPLLETGEDPAVPDPLRAIESEAAKMIERMQAISAEMAAIREHVALYLVPPGYENTSELGD